MFDSIFTVIFVFVTLLLLVATIRDWQVTKHTWDALPAVPYLFAVVSFIADPRLLGIPWLTGVIWILIGVVLRVVMRRRFKQQ